MSTGAVVRGRFPRTVENLNRYGGAAGRGLDDIGRMAWFGMVAVGNIPPALRNYRKETLRLIAQIGMGAGATAELGAMRISEEIDALEVMGVKSISFLASTRIMAGLVVIIPLYSLAMIASFLSPQITTTVLYGQSHGTYEHYFRTFLRPDDVFWSFVEAIIITVVVMITHCFYGYNAGGGPVGVGEAVGRSMRFSLVSVQVVVLAAALALYGVNPNFALTV